MVNCKANPSELETMRFALNRPESSEQHAELTSASDHAFSRLWSLGTLLLMMGTAPIWFSSPMETLGLLEVDYFPRVTWFSVLGDGFVKAAFELAALFALISSLLLLLAGGERRWVWGVAAISLIGLVLLDQIRLQPWVYQTVVYGIVIGCLGFTAGRRLIVPVAISIYLFSAAGKLDYQFTHTVGNEFVRTLFDPVIAIETETATSLALALPIGELLVGVLLIFQITRRVGGIAAMILHTTLVGLLGPWSLDHSFGVLLWNLLLIGQAWLLFLRQPKQVDHHDRMWVRDRKYVLARIFSTGLVVIVCLMPLTERSGYWDHWMSWALYSPHSSRTTIQIHRSAIDQVAPSVARHLQEDTDGDGWRDLDWGSWSLESRWVPAYPQARYQLVAALTMASDFKLTAAIRARLKETSDRWTGQRQERFLLNQSEMADATEAFILVPSRKTWDDSNQ